GREPVRVSRDPVAREDSGARATGERGARGGGGRTGVAPAASRARGVPRRAARALRHPRPRRGAAGDGPARGGAAGGPMNSGRPPSTAPRDQAATGFTSLLETLIKQLPEALCA